MAASVVTVRALLHGVLTDVQLLRLVILMNLRKSLMMRSESITKAASAAVGVHIGLPQGPVVLLMLTLHVIVTRKLKLTRSEQETRPAR